MPAVSPLPIWAGGLSALALCFLVLPLAFMLGRVNWATLGSTLATPEAASALGLSLRTCAIALGVDLLLGVPPPSCCHARGGACAPPASSSPCRSRCRP